MEELLGPQALHRTRIEALLLFTALKRLIPAPPNVQGRAPIKLALNVALLLVKLADLKLPEATEG
jgi:hypothetical protein